jgi:hypothetical protein
VRGGDRLPRRRGAGRRHRAVRASGPRPRGRTRFPAVWPPRLAGERDRPVAPT